MDDETDSTASAPDPAEPAFRMLSLILLAIGLVWSVFIELRILTSLHRFDKIFADLKISLPILTRVVLSTPFRLLVPVLAVVAIAKELAVANRRWTLLANGVLLLALLVIQEMFTMAIWGPLFSLMDPLG